MKQAIIEIIYPQKLDDGLITGDQSRALTRISEIARAECKQSEAVHALGERTWLLSLDKALPILCRLVEAAESSKIPYRVTYFDNELQWDSFNEEFAPKPIVSST